MYNLPKSFTQDVLDDLENGKSNIDKINDNSEVLLTSYLGTFISNQLRQLNSRYEVKILYEVKN